jgi:hypothetical protein
MRTAQETDAQHAALETRLVAACLDGLLTRMRGVIAEAKIAGIVMCEWPAAYHALNITIEQAHTYARYVDTRFMHINPLAINTRTSMQVLHPGTPAFLLRELLEEGVDPNSPLVRVTPMWKAIASNNCVMVALLASYGAKPTFDGTLKRDGSRLSDVTAEHAWQLARYCHRNGARELIGRTMLQLIAKLGRMPHPFYFLGNNLLFGVDRLRRSLVSGWGNEAINGRFMAMQRIVHRPRRAGVAGVGCVALTSPLEMWQKARTDKAIAMSVHRTAEQRSTVGCSAVLLFLAWHAQVAVARAASEYAKNVVALHHFLLGLRAECGARSLVFTMLHAIPAGKVFKGGYKPDAILLAIAEFVHHPTRRVSTVPTESVSNEGASARPGTPTGEPDLEPLPVFVMGELL